MRIAMAISWIADLDEFTSVARRAEATGFGFVSIGDNPAHIHDTYVSLAVLAQATSTVPITTTTTNPSYRDPLVVATSAASIQELAGGRFSLGLATGRARPRATVAELEEHINVVRTLWEHGAAEYRGEMLHMGWKAPTVPIMVCGSGPRSLRLAGRVADAVLVEGGVTTEMCEWARKQVAAGARSAGRDPEELEVWWYVKAAIGLDEAEARAIGRAALAASGAHSLGRRASERHVPERFWAGCQELAERYDMNHHVSGSPDNPNAALLRDPELEDYLMDRFGLIGTSAQWQDRLKTLAARGIENVFCAAVVPDRMGFVDLVGTQVIPFVGS
jgi:5,10-methylenetetrahydromethanopterin reductase